MLNASVVSTRATDGNTRNHQACWYDPCESESIWPQSAVGGWIPTPRNDRDASATMLTGMSSVAYTMSWAVTLGRMSMNMMRQALAPRDRAASMYSFSRMESTWPRTIRATAAHPNTAMTMMTIWRLGPSTE